MLGLRLAPSLTARGAHLRLWPPAHPAPSPCSPPAAARLPCAAHDARTPVRPHGLPGGKKPQPGQAESQCSSGAGLCGQGQALRCAPGGASASLDRAHPAAGPTPAAWPENGLGSVPQPHRWRSRWSRLGSLPARQQAAGLHRPGEANMPAYRAAWCLRERARHPRALSRGRRRARLLQVPAPPRPRCRPGSQYYTRARAPGAWRC